jgi:hypothetical protein
MPRKPTDPFGAWIFSKDGRVRQEVSKLPDNKEGQEAAVIKRFIERYNESQPTCINPDFVALEEANHDFQVLVDGRTVIVQVTEIIERSYVITKGAKPTPGSKEGIIRFKVGAPGQQEIDISKRNRALETAIRRKVEKHYSKPASEFWLLVFSTDVGLSPELTDAEFEDVRTPLEYAQDYLEGVDVVFDQIWFINVYASNPLLVWDATA